MGDSTTKHHHLDSNKSCKCIVILNMGAVASGIASIIGGNIIGKIIPGLGSAENVKEATGGRNYHTSNTRTSTTIDSNDKTQIDSSSNDKTNNINTNDNDCWFCGWNWGGFRFTNLHPTLVHKGQRRRGRRSIALKHVNRYKRSNVDNALFDENLPTIPEQYEKYLPRTIQDMELEPEPDLSKFGKLESTVKSLLNATEQRILEADNDGLPNIDDVYDFDGNFDYDGQPGRYKRDAWFEKDSIVSFSEIFSIDSVIDNIFVIYMMLKIMRIGHPKARPYYNDICKSKTFQEKNITIMNCEEILFQALKKYEDEDVDDYIGTIENIITEDATKQYEAEETMDYVMENIDDLMYEMELVVGETYEGEGIIQETCEGFPHNYLKCIDDFNEKMVELRLLYDKFASDSDGVDLPLLE